MVLKRKDVKKNSQQLISNTANTLDRLCFSQCFSPLLYFLLGLVAGSAHGLCAGTTWMGCYSTHLKQEETSHNGWPCHNPGSFLLHLPSFPSMPWLGRRGGGGCTADAQVVPGQMWFYLFPIPCSPLLPPPPASLCVQSLWPFVIRMRLALFLGGVRSGTLSGSRSLITGLG